MPSASRPSRASQSARLLVLDMILWPGLLFVSGTALVGWQVRSEPLVWPALLAGTLLSLWVAKHQWGAMLRTALRPSDWLSATGKEASPQLIGRGATAPPPTDRRDETEPGA